VRPLNVGLSALTPWHKGIHLRQRVTAHAGRVCPRGFRRNASDPAQLTPLKPKVGGAYASVFRCASQKARISKSGFSPLRRVRQLFRPGPPFGRRLSDQQRMPTNKQSPHRRDGTILFHLLPICERICGNGSSLAKLPNLINTRWLYQYLCTSASVATGGFEANNKHRSKSPPQRRTGPHTAALFISTRTTPLTQTRTGRAPERQQSALPIVDRRVIKRCEFAT
jgi:hypothetical protein